MRRLTTGAAVVLGTVLAGGASVYALRASGGTPGCPPREKLRMPDIDFVQAPRYYVDVTLTNPNACYGFRDRPVEITLYGPHNLRAISYFGDGGPHSDVGLCCVVTLPPHGTWTVRLGGPVNPKGLRDLTICNIHVETLRGDGSPAWTRMPEGGAIVGHGSFPPGFTPRTPDPSETPDTIWLDPCDSPSPAPSP